MKKERVEICDIYDVVDALNALSGRISKLEKQQKRISSNQTFGTIIFGTTGLLLYSCYAYLKERTDILETKIETIIDRENGME